MSTRRRFSGEVQGPGADLRDRSWWRYANRWARAERVRGARASPAPSDAARQPNATRARPRRRPMGRGPHGRQRRNSGRSTEMFASKNRLPEAHTLSCGRYRWTRTPVPRRDGLHWSSCSGGAYLADLVGDIEPSSVIGVFRAPSRIEHKSRDIAACRAIQASIEYGC